GEWGGAGLWRDGGRGVGGGGPTAAAIIADAVFLPVGVVGVARPEAVGNVAVVLRALVGVFDRQLDRRAGRHPVESAAHDAHQIGFAPPRRVARLARLALVEPVLDVALGERQARRHAVDDDPDRRAVALTPGGEAEQSPE